MTDPARPEPHTAASDDHRRFVVRAWYPAQASASKPASYFLAPGEAAINAMTLGLPATAFDDVPTHAAVDAPVAAAPARFPVIVFSPARNIPVPFYSYELEDLASRGFAVFAVSHPYGPYGSGHTVFADGSVAEMFGAVFADETREQAVTTWSADERFTLDVIGGWAQAGSSNPLGRRLDLQRVGVFGHSVGGAAAARSCLDDRRFVACGNLDGSVGTADEVGVPPITRPFLLMRAEATVESTLDGFFAGLAGVAYQMKVLGAGHDSFSDLSNLLEHLRTRGIPFDASAVALGTLTPLRRYQVVSAHLDAFFGATLQDRPSPLLQDNPAYPEVKVVRRN
jgi:predicted dienelactone hydrolase